MFSNRNNAARKVTSDQVAEIRRRYEKGETQGALSRAYQLSIGQIGRIVRFESWQGADAQRAPTPEELHEIALRLIKTQESVGIPPSPLDEEDDK